MSGKKQDPIEIYQRAVDLILPTVAGIGESQLELATPCTEWSVRQLVNHNLAIQGEAAALLRKQEVDALPDLNAAFPDGPESALRNVTQQVLDTLKSIDLDETLDTWFGPMAAGSYVMFPMADLVVHKWDLAKATGQSDHIESSLAEICYQTLAPAAVMARELDICGPEVPVSSTASIHHRLLGMAGRQP